MYKAINMYKGTNLSLLAILAAVMFICYPAVVQADRTAIHIPGNDLCQNAFPIFDGITPFSNVGAGTQGVWPCGAGGSDIWYTYTATCDGQVSYDTCIAGSYDSTLAVYDGPNDGPGCTAALNSSSLLQCNDDAGCGFSPGFSSMVTVPVIGGQDYIVRVGGFVGSQGVGFLNIVPFTTLCIVDIDIKPSNIPNLINPFKSELIPVAILGSNTLDVADVDVTTLAFGPNGAAPVDRAGGQVEDVNFDGIDDLVSHYRTQETGIACGDTEACVTGNFLNGTQFEGCDFVNTLDGDDAGCPPGR